MKRFIRPMYFRPDQLSEPFLLVSQIDHRYLEVNKETGLLGIRHQRPVHVLQDGKHLKDFPPEAVWYYAETTWGKQLVNGAAHAGFGGKVTYNPSTGRIDSEIGTVSRNFGGRKPDIAYGLSQAWTQMTQFVMPLYFPIGGLSDPFVLYSAFDRKLLQVCSRHLHLKVRDFDPEILRDPSKIEDLPPEAKWYTIDTDDGKQLVNGLTHAMDGKMIFDESTAFIVGLNGHVSRIWDAGKQKHLVAWKEERTGAAPEWFMWHKPKFYPADELSRPFVLVSESDWRMIQTNEEDGSLEMGEKRNMKSFTDLHYLNAMPLHQLWYRHKSSGALISANVGTSPGEYFFNGLEGFVQAGTSGVNAGQYLIRTRTGTLRHSDAFTWTNQGQRWLRSYYVEPDSLKDPFVLISDKDHRMLEVSNEGILQMGPLRTPAVVQSPEGIKTVAAHLQWYLVETEFGRQLFNAYGWTSMGLLIYDNETRILKAGRGWVGRFVDSTVDGLVYSSSTTGAATMYTPKFFSPEELSPESVLVSKMDGHLLIVTMSGTFDVGEKWDSEIVTNYSRVKALDPAAKWSVKKYPGGFRLVSSLLHYMGRIDYDGHRIFGPKGYMTRNWAGWKPTILWQKDAIPGTRQIFSEPRNA